VTIKDDEEKRSTAEEEEAMATIVMLLGELFGVWRPCMLKPALTH
jgi:hypothetical protein